MKKQLEIEYAFGYVYDKSKLIVIYPAGTNVIDLDEYEMEVEVAFLEDGIEVAFEENDIMEANEIIKPLETFLILVLVLLKVILINILLVNMDIMLVLLKKIMITNIFVLKNRAVIMLVNI